MDSRLVRYRAVAIIALAMVALLLVIDQVTSAPAVCGSCHSMESRHDSWSRSPHAQVKCVTCHVDPEPWYAHPVEVSKRGLLLGRDVYLHVASASGSPESQPGVVHEPIADEVCLQCHDVNRKATSGFRILIDHPEHARRNGSCVSCHVLTAHPVPTRGAAMTLMTQCFTCHGTAEQPEASADCGTCHPADYELEPGSHKQAKWAKSHGRVSEQDPAQCGMCHQQSFCDDCHGLPMPHPAGFAQGGAEEGHAPLGKTNRALCANCHEDKPDLCSMCHHKAMDPAQGEWVKQHYGSVEKQGVAYCFECHAPTYCVRCHVGRLEE